MQDQNFSVYAAIVAGLEAVTDNMRVVVLSMLAIVFTLASVGTLLGIVGMSFISGLGVLIPSWKMIYIDPYAT